MVGGVNFSLFSSLSQSFPVFGMELRSITSQGFCIAIGLFMKFLGSAF